VHCQNNKSIPQSAFAAHDAIIVVNGPAEVCLQLRPHLSPRTRLFLWTGFAPNQPALYALQRPEVRAGWDAVVCVSHWHADVMRQGYKLEPNRVEVLRNAIAPAFENLFPDKASLAAAKSAGPILAYTSTPHRGLEILLSLFPEVHRLDARTRLRVYSSMAVYYQDQSKDESAHLYEQCRTTPGVEYVGAIAQPLLAESLKSALVLAYPNIWAETSCIAVMEAMAAGLLVVTSEFGALPETTMGMGLLVPGPRDPQEFGDFARRYAARLIAALGQITPPSDQFWQARWEQVRALTTQHTWSVRAAEWEAMLNARGANVK
jgi:glycosyltransferase involved in cell wall biosynthesis